MDRLFCLQAVILTANRPVFKVILDTLLALFFGHTSQSIKSHLWVRVIHCTDYFKLALINLKSSALDLLQR